MRVAAGAASRTILVSLVAVLAMSVALVPVAGPVRAGGS